MTQTELLANICADILEVSDEEVWRYGQQLRRMADENGCRNIRFSRICDLVGAGHESESLNEEMYLTRVSEYRSLLKANTPPDFNVLDAITNDPDISETYKGYSTFYKPIRHPSSSSCKHSLISATLLDTDNKWRSRKILDERA